MPILRLVNLTNNFKPMWHQRDSVQNHKVQPGSRNLLEFLAALRLRSSIPQDVSVFVEKENVQFDVVFYEGQFQTVLHLQIKRIKYTKQTALKY